MKIDVNRNTIGSFALSATLPSRKPLFLLAPILLVAIFICQAPLFAIDNRPSKKDIEKADELAQHAMQLLLDDKGRQAAAELMEEALELNSGNLLARAHLGYIRSPSGWRRLEDEEKAKRGDKFLRQYREFRTAATTAEAQRRLAGWCARHGLLDRGRLHIAQLHNASKRTTTLERSILDKLGFQISKESRNGLTSREISNRNKQSQKQRQRDWNHWTPKVARLAEQLESRSSNQRHAACKKLLAIDSAEAIPSIDWVLANKEPVGMQIAISILRKMPEHQATKSLTRYAVNASTSENRALAADALASRPIHDYVPWLLNELVSPLRSRYWVQLNARGDIEYQHDVFQEGATENQISRSHNFVKHVPRDVVVRKFGSKNPEDWRVIKDTGRYQPNRANAASQVQSQIIQLENETLRHNERAEEINNRLSDVLRRVTNQPIEGEPVEWWEWWYEYNELESPDRKQLVSYYNNTTSEYYHGNRVCYIPSCFPAGTPVRTETGPMAIEEIQIGDRVLSQDLESGELAHKLVLGTTIRPATPLIEIRCDNQSFSATRGHPLWIVGKGWKMAKFVVPGDRLQSLRGPLEVKTVSERAAAKAYNLIVADYSTYFVDQVGFLVHDNTLRKPTLRVIPGFSPKKQ